MRSWRVCRREPATGGTCRSDSNDERRLLRSQLRQWEHERQLEQPCRLGLREPRIRAGRHDDEVHHSDAGRWWRTVRAPAVPGGTSRGFAGELYLAFAHETSRSDHWARRGYRRSLPRRGRTLFSGASQVAESSQGRTSVRPRTSSPGPSLGRPRALGTGRTDPWQAYGRVARSDPSHGRRSPRDTRRCPCSAGGSERRGRSWRVCCDDCPCSRSPRRRSGSRRPPRAGVRRWPYGASTWRGTARSSSAT